MKKITGIILLLLFAFTCANAQRNYIDSLQRMVNNLPDTAKMKMYASLGNEYLNISTDSCAMYVSMSLELAQKYSDKNTAAKDYSLLGVLEKDKGNYEKAITYHLQSLKIYEAANDEKGMAIAYNDIGVLYKSMKRWDEAIGYYRKSNELCRKIKLSKGISMTYNNMGTIMKELSNRKPVCLDSALLYYQFALNEAKKKGDPYDMSTCLSNIGEIYIDRMNFDTALSIFNQCLEYDKGAEDKYGMCISYLHLGNIYLNLKSLGKATAYCDSAYNISRDEGMLREKLDVMETQVKIKRAEHDTAAMKIMDAYIGLKDSIINEETAKQISELQTKYETVKKEKELSRKELLIQQRNYQIAGITGGVLLLSIIAFSLYSRQQAKQKQAREKAVQAAEFNERMRIAKDVHDDLGAGLSKISLMANAAEQSAPANGTAASDIHQIAAVSKGLIDNMRDLIWVLNPENTTLDNLVARLREYCADYLDGMHVHETLDFPQEVPSMRISRESQRNIFSTVKEAINNSVKHSGASEIKITLTLANNTLKITVADNGKGFDMGRLKGSGNGLRNMKQRIEAAGGSFSIASSPSSGTAITIAVSFDKLGHEANFTTIV